MRIVIIGEYSSFAKNLSEGFRALGHECFVFSWGDGFKKIEQDRSSSYTINAQYKGNNVFEHILFAFHSTIIGLKLQRFVASMSKKGKFDSVLILSESFVREKGRFWQARFSKKMILSLVKSSNNIYLSACGSDVPFYDYWKDKKWKNRSMMSSFNKYGSKQCIKHHLYVTSFVNKVIPVMYGYAEAWRNSVYSSHCNILKTIPLPINCSKYTPHNKVEGKIVVFHGITRPEVKGTPFIVEALNRLQYKYPELVECIAEGGMPLNDYLKLMERTNVQIDQACCEYVGMNGLYGMAMGKVLLGGNEEENRNEFEEFDCPIINIQPDSQQIYEALENLILHKDKIASLSKKMREYVERTHDSIIIAKKYVEVFESGGKNV